RTDGDAVSGPKRHAGRVHALGVDVVVGAVAAILPDDDCPAGAVRHARRVLLIAGGRAERHVAAVWILGPRGLDTRGSEAHKPQSGEAQEWRDPRRRDMSEKAGSG